MTAGIDDAQSARPSGVPTNDLHCVLASSSSHVFIAASAERIFRSAVLLR
jgi:hypothetical protein